MTTQTKGEPMNTPTAVPTFEQVSSAFMDAIAPVFDRWQDEYKYEADEFAAYFQRNVCDAIGGTVTRVSGSARVMRIDATFPDCRRVLTARLKGSTLSLDVQRTKGPAAPAR